MPRLAEVQDVVQRLWPVEGAEDWDSVGLVSGDPAAEVARVLLAVDAVADTVDEAISAGAQLLLTHHPLLLRGVTSVAEDRYKGAMLARLIRSGCALLAAHTNADVVEAGTSAVLAERLGLTDVRPLDPARSTGSSADEQLTGIGRVGRLPVPLPLGALASRLAAALPATASGIRGAGDFERPVETVAVCAGAGDAYLSHPAVVAADVYITSDLRHHPASEARERALLGRGPALLDVSHWASEWLWLDRAADQLRAELPGVRVEVSETRTDPWDFAIAQ